MALDGAGHREQHPARVDGGVIHVFDDPDQRPLCLANARIRSTRTAWTESMGSGGASHAPAVLQHRRHGGGHETRRLGQIRTDGGLQIRRSEVREDRTGQGAELVGRCVRAVQHVLVVSVDRLEEGVEEAGLPDAGLADDEQERVAATGPSLLPGPLQSAERVASPEESRLTSHGNARNPSLAVPGHALVGGPPPGGLTRGQRLVEADRRGEAALGILGQQVRHDCGEEGGHIGMRVRQGGRPRLQVRAHHRHRRGVAEGILAGEQLVGHDAHRVEVRGGLDVIAAELLRGRVEHRARELTDAREPLARPP